MIEAFRKLIEGRRDPISKTPFSIHPPTVAAKLAEGSFLSSDVGPLTAIVEVPLGQTVESWRKCMPRQCVDIVAASPNGNVSFTHARNLGMEKSLAQALLAHHGSEVNVMLVNNTTPGDWVASSLIPALTGAGLEVTDNTGSLATGDDFFTAVSNVANDAWCPIVQLKQRVIPDFTPSFRAPVTIDLRWK